MTRETDCTTVALALALALAPLTTVADIKCWTNRDNVRECGDAVPPEYAQQSREVMSKQGIVVKKLDRAKTPEELAAEKKTADEATQREQEAAEQKKRDKVLLDTFATEDDVLLTRDGKISSIEQVIKLTESRIDKLRQNLQNLIGEAAATERRGDSVPDGMRRDIESLNAQIDEQKGFIDRKRTEQDAVRAQFDGYLARLRELKSSVGATGPKPQ